eukprot:4835591-Amphidinium_carterae.1
MRHRRDWPSPLQGRLAVNKLNFCLPLAKGHILGALARHSRFSAAGLWDSTVDRLVASLESSGFGRFGASQSSSQQMRHQQDTSASQSSLALVKPDRKSYDDIRSRACPKDELAVKVEKKRFCADQAIATTKVEPQKELLALTLPVPAQRRARRRYQARWKPIELTIEAREKLHACLSSLNFHNREGKKHDIGIAYGEVLDFSPCHLVKEAS